MSEGQRVLVNCSADSSPALATVAWQHSGGNVLDLVASHSIGITQTCDVTTEKRGDDRLPLQGSQEFTVLVTCEQALHIAVVVVDRFYIALFSALARSCL